MKLLRITYKERVYYRRPTHGGMDSEPAGSAIEEKSVLIVIPGDEGVDWTIDWFSCRHSQYKDFELLRWEIVDTVYAIMQPPLMRLS